MAQNTLPAPAPPRRSPLGFFRNLRTSRKLLAGFLVIVALAQAIAETHPDAVSDRHHGDEFLSRRAHETGYRRSGSRHRTHHGGLFGLNLDGEEEERRLFYVAVTRAKSELYMSYPLMRFMHGSGGETLQQPSRFLDEIGDDLVEEWNLQSFDPYG